MVACSNSASSEQQQQQQSLPRTAPHPNIIVRKPSSTLPSLSSPPSSPMGAPLAFPPLLEQAAEDKENARRGRSMSDGAVVGEGLPARALQSSETKESGGELAGPRAIATTGRDSMVGPSPSFMSSSPGSSSQSHGATTRTVSTSFSSVTSSVSMAKLASSRTAEPRVGAHRALRGEPISFDQQRTSLPSRPRVNTQVSGPWPTAVPPSRPQSRPQHQRRASSNDVSSWGPTSSRLLSLASNSRSTSSHRPHTADPAPSPPPPFADYSFASSPSSVPSSNNATPPLSKSSRGGGTVGRLRKKASISFRAALGSGKEEERDGTRPPGRERERNSGRLELDTTIRPGVASSARIAATVGSPRSATSGRSSSSSSRPRPSVQSIDFNSPTIPIPLSPLDTVAFSPVITPKEGSRAVVSTADSLSTSRRRSNTSGHEGKGFLGSLLRLKKSTSNLRGERAPPSSANPQPLPPPLPPLLPKSTLRPRLEPRRERGDQSTSSNSTSEIPRPIAVPIARDEPQRWTPAQLPSERKSSSRSQRQYTSTDSLPLGSSPSSISFMQPPSSRGSSPGPSRPSFTERRRGVSSTRSTSSSRSFRTAQSESGHGAPSTCSHEVSRRSEDAGARNQDVYGAPIVDFSEVVRALPKSSTSSSISTIDLHSPYPTALSPPPRRPPRLRPSTASSVVTGSPSSARSFASLRPRTADGSMDTPFRHYKPSEDPWSSSTSLARVASGFVGSTSPSSPPATPTASVPPLNMPNAPY